MKTKLHLKEISSFSSWRRIAVASGILTTSLLFSFCGGSKTNKDQLSSNSIAVAQNDGKQELDTLLDKYCGLYAWGTNTSKPSYVSIGWFPENTFVKDENGPGYRHLDAKFIGKYFCEITDGYWHDPKKVTDLSKYTPNHVVGYIAPGAGNIFVGAAQSGDIMIQNYDDYHQLKEAATVIFSTSPSSAYGKFIKRPDGKYNISVRNVTYEYQGIFK